MQLHTTGHAPLSRNRLVLISTPSIVDLTEVARKALATVP